MKKLSVNYFTISQVLFNKAIKRRTKTSFHKHFKHLPFADIDECFPVELSGCHEKASCTNVEGSFYCEFNEGYNGNGITCAGKLVLP